MFTAQQYNGFKRRNARYLEWAKQFVKPNGWTVIPKTAKPPVKVTNHERSACEVYEWHHNPPKEYFCYVELDKRQVTTWMSDSLGRIIDHGHEWQSNFGDTRQSITIKATNGLYYQGVYYKSAGQYARIRRIARPS